MTFLLRSAMCDLMPAAAGLPGIVDTDVDGFLDRLWRETTWMMWGTLVLGALLFVVTPFLTLGIPLPTLVLSRTLRDRHADRIVTTRFYLIRQAVFLLKMYACICWGEADVVRRQLHVAPYPASPGTFRAS